MNNKRAIIFILLLFFSCSLFAQSNTGTIKGAVITNGNRPASSVTIYISQIRRSAVADDNGHFIIRNVLPGNYTIEVSLVGYETFRQMVNVQAGKTTDVHLQLQLSERQLQEVIVTTANKFKSIQSDDANKMPLANIENPQSVATVTAGLIKDQILFSADDALRNASGVQQMWQPTGRAGDGGSWFDLRGFATNINMRNGFVSYITTTTDVVNMEKLEILKGPSSTLFGGGVINSYGGIINRVTKKPYAHFGGEINLASGSYDFYRGSLDINTPLDKAGKVMFRLNGSFNSQGGFQKETGTGNRTFIAPSLLIKPNDKLSVQLDAELTYAKSVPGQFVFLYFTAADLGFDNPANSGLDYKQSYTGNDIRTTSRSSNYYANMSYNFSNKFTSSTNISYSRSYSDGHNQYFFQIPNYYVTGNEADYGTPSVYLARGDQSTRNSHNNVFQAQQYFNGDFYLGKMRNRAVFGLDYANIDAGIYFFSPLAYIDVVPIHIPGFDYTTFNAAAIDKFYDTANASLVQSYPVVSNTNIYSAFVSDILNLTDKLSVLAAVRLDHFNNKDKASASSYDQTTLSPKFGIIYQPVKEQVSLFANYQNSFSNQGSYIAYDPTASDSLISKYAKPEHADQWEVGVKTNLIKNKLTATASYYHIKVKDALRTDDRLAGNKAQTQNGTQLSRGFELDINSNPIKGLTIIAGLAYNDFDYQNTSADISGFRYSGAPWLANWWVSYQFSNELKGLHIGFGGNYASKNDIQRAGNNAGTFYLPSYTVLNATAGYDFKKLGIALKVDNLNNEHYWQGYTTYNPQMLRQFVGSLSYKFQ